MHKTVREIDLFHIELLGYGAVAGCDVNNEPIDMKRPGNSGVWDNRPVLPAE